MGETTTTETASCSTQVHGGVLHQVAGQSRHFTPHRVDTDERGVVSYVNQEFLRFTGFSASEFLGRKCDFLQGLDTDPEDVSQLSRAVSRGKPASVVILNYTKGGLPFWNILRIQPLQDGACGEATVSFVGDIISLPVPPELRAQPRLCFDDALALMRVFGSVPRSVKTSQQFLLEFAPAQRLMLPVPPGDNAGEEDGGSRGGTLKDAAATEIEGSLGGMNRYIHYGRLFPDATSSQGRCTNPEMPTRSQVMPRYQVASAATGDGDAAAHRPGCVVRRALDFVAETSLPTSHGRFRVRAYRDPQTGAEPLAMIVGEVEGGEGVACRVHDQCVTSEVFGSLRCDCKQQLDAALLHMQREKLGLVLYLPQARGAPPTLFSPRIT